MKTEIVIPVYNEGDSIGELLTSIHRDVLQGTFSVTIVHDDEADTTLPALDRWEKENGVKVNRIRNKYGRGALNAIRTGMEEADSEYVVVTMADLSDPPAVINDMIRKADEEKADIVCASRYMKGGRQIGGPLLKGLMSRCAGLSLHALCGLPTHDPTNSFKLYRKSFLDKMTVESTGGFELGLELVVKAWKQGYKIAEVPTTWRDRVNGKSNFKLWKWLPHYLHWYFTALCGKNDLPKKESFVRFGGLVLFLLFLVAHLPDPVPLLTALDQGGLDPSWIRILCYVHQQNLQFGRDVIFTYGPLGYLLFPYDPVQLFISSLFTVALLLPFGFIFIRKRTVTSLFFLLLFTFLSLFHTINIANPSYEVFIFLFPLLIWNISEEKNLKIKYGLILYCCITGAACILVKFMSVPIVLFSLLTADIMLLRRNKIILALPALLLFLLLIWCFPARQNLSNLFPFLIYSWHIASGYNNVMAIGPAAESPLWIPWLGLNAAVLLFPALFANRKHEPRISAVDRICFILLLALILFIAGKYGIVRMDPWHIIPAVHYMILIAAFCSVMPGIALKWRIVLITPAILLTVSIAVCYGERVFSANCTNMLLVFLAALLIYVLNSCAASNHVSRIIRVSVSAVFIFLAGYKFFLPWAVGQMNNYRAFSKHVPVVFADIPQDSPVTADCFSHEIFYLLQSKVKYAPRFVFQSYSAYTPQLLQKNASHFEYDSGPDYIFLGWQEIDGKLPSSFDSLSLLKIMNNYEAVPGKMLLSKKKERPAAVHLEEIRTENADFEGRIDLPQGEPFVWISIDFQESAAGFLLKKLVKPSSVLIRINLDNGRSVSHLINPEICSIPFLLSPYLPGWQYLDYMLISEGKDFPKVTSFSVFPFFFCFSYTDQKSSAPYFKSGGQWDRDIGRFFFKEGIKVHFYRMASSSVNQEKQKP